MRKAKRLSAEERRKVLIRSAIEVFSESNFQVAKIAEISNRAGVSDATVYKYFESKKELFLEILRKTSKKTLDNYLGANYEDFNKVKNKEELRAFIQEGLLSYLNSMEKYRKEIKIYYQAISEIDDPDVQKVIKNTYEMYAGFYDSILRIAKEKNLIESGIDTMSLALDIIGFTIHQSTLFIMGFYEKSAAEYFLKQRLQIWV